MTDASLLRARLEEALRGAYAIDRELGGGGMSRVFLAQELALARRVVIKVLAPDLAHDLSAERFAREIRLCASFPHPNIVPILTAGEADGLSYYTMPFVAGESLRAELARRTQPDRVPLPRALDILRDVARALAHAHRHGIVHRDIKPDNVLLAGDAALVADFGVAKAWDAALPPGASRAAATLTRQGVSVGTPAYMSPEQASGDADLDPRADLYAWGVVAYELLAGAHPFAHCTSGAAMIRAHVVEAPAPLADIAPDVPPAVSAIVMRCLSKAREARPSDAAELVETLGRAADRAFAVSDPANARVTPSAGSGGRGLRSRAGLVGVAAVAVIGVAVAWLVRAPSRGGGSVPPRVATAQTAEETYLRGKVRVSVENRTDNLAAIAALQQAVAADPGMARAHATLARAYAIHAFYFAPDSARKGLLEDAEVEVEKALALDPHLGEALLARGVLLWTPGRRFPHEEAIHAFRQALTYDSSLDEAHHQLGMVYMHIGMLAEAEEEFDRALALNPGNTLARFRHGVVAQYRGDFARSHAVFTSTPLERNPSLWAFQEATALFRMGRVAEATALIDRFLRDYPRDEGGVGHSVRAMILAAAGRRSDAEQAIAEARDLGKNFGHFHHAAYNIGSAYALLGMKDEALQSLQEAVDGGFPCYPLFATDPQLDALRGDSRFIHLLDGLKRDLRTRARSL
ncbi:MAG: protein kinase [Gemmatimonadetes bacterium]|nr:protein kinase [Gemmatimonadota bacterium]